MSKGVFVDLTSQRFGKLVVIERVQNQRHQPMWKCQCECGSTPIIRGAQLRSGITRSCGCLKTKHGMSKSYLYKCWQQMKQRCTNFNSEDWRDYGGRGITVCERWLDSFENFYEDMGHRPTSNHSIDRIDNNGNYEPSNCRWATASQQQFNKRCSNRKNS